MTRECPGPLPVRAPRVKPPAGACDAHIHVIGPYNRYPLYADRSYTAPESPVEDYKAVMATLGTERVVLVQCGGHGFHNEIILDAVAHIGAGARGIAVVPPNVSDIELDRLNAGGIRGVRMVTKSRGGLGPEHVVPMAKQIARLGWHVQLLLEGPAQIEAMELTLASLPVPVVIDSLGRTRPEDGVDHSGFKAILRLLERGNTWVKFNSVERRTHVAAPFSDITPLAKAMIAVRPDRLVWGSDWPHLSAFNHDLVNDADLLEWLLEMDIDARTKEMILVDNPVKLYGFGPL